MKTFSKYLPFFGMLLALLACGNHYDYEASNLKAGLSPASSSSGIAFNVQYTRLYGLSKGEPGTTVISSKNEIEQYYENQEIEQYYGKQEIKNTIEKYPDDYFADNFLVIVERWEQSGSITHKVERIDENGDIIINRLIPSPFLTDDIGHWSIIIELNNKFKLEQFQTVFVDVAL